MLLELGATLTFAAAAAAAAAAATQPQNGRAYWQENCLQHRQERDWGECVSGPTEDTLQMHQTPTYVESQHPDWS